METNKETHRRTTYRMRDLGTLHPKWDVSINSHLSLFREPHGRRGKKTARARQNVGHQRNKVLLTQQDRWTYKLTKIMAACIEQAWVWTKWGSSAERKSGHLSSLTLRRSLINNNFQIKMGVLSNEVSLGIPISQREVLMPSSRWPIQNEFSCHLCGYFVRTFFFLP